MTDAAVSGLPVLTVNNMEYRGWTGFSVLRSMEALSSGFDMEISQNFLPGTDTSSSVIRWAIKPGDRCTLALGEVVLIDGWVDDRSRSLAATSHTLQVSGRDVTCDLVDCSAVVSPEMWRGQKLEAIAQALAAPHKIKVVAEVDTGKPFPVFKIQPGETGFAAIERMCRLRAVLAISNGAGTITLTRASKEFCEDALVEGVNVLKVDVAETFADRFSSYTVKTQQISVDGWTEAAHVVATATDAGITRSRPMLLLAEAGGGKGHAQKRVEWVAAVRAGRSQTVTVIVQGWHQSDGTLWPLNRLTNVVIPTYDLEGVLLIKEVTYGFNGSEGTTTRLTLVDPKSFEPEPTIPENRGLPQNVKEIKSAADLEKI